MTDNCDKRLADCLATVRVLEEENEQLRESAVSFRELAGRLNDALSELPAARDDDENEEESARQSAEPRTDGPVDPATDPDIPPKRS
jgi:hypothetical protein